MKQVRSYVSPSVKIWLNRTCWTFMFDRRSASRERRPFFFLFHDRSYSGSWQTSDTNLGFLSAQNFRFNLASIDCTSSSSSSANVPLEMLRKCKSPEQFKFQQRIDQLNFLNKWVWVKLRLVKNYQLEYFIGNSQFFICRNDLYSSFLPNFRSLNCTIGI